jgi:hypothetical protein
MPGRDGHNSKSLKRTLGILPQWPGRRRCTRNPDDIIVAAFGEDSYVVMCKLDVEEEGSWVQRGS